jgi:hypothetical protein
MIKINILEGYEDIKDIYCMYKRLNKVYFKNVKTGKTIKPFRKAGKANGYMYLKLTTKDNKSKNIRIHRLIAIAYIKTNDITLEVDHIDEDRTNYKINNLQWISKKKNMLYRWNKTLRELEV